ncbi:hypothetical protein [Mycobacterium sp. NPDC050853]|uniref:hypothetical protein n=1 Tax=Mycobacterium sp. NPDC050853 TaxID=3155160 RepID=UPI0033EF7653
MNWTTIAAIDAPILSLIGIIAAALISHHISTKQANTADWSAYGERIEKELERQAGEIVDLTKRVAESEERSKVNAGRYRVAIGYIREIADWVASKLPGEKLPDAPADLAEDLEHP